MKIPETVIIEMQGRAWHYKNEIKQLEKVKHEKLTEYEKATKNVNYAKSCLFEIADFLQEHNKDAIKRDSSWYAELGIQK